MATAPQEWNRNKNWTSDLVWTIYIRETSFTPNGNRKKLLLLSNSVLAALTTPCQQLDTVKEKKRGRNVGTEPILEQGVRRGITGRTNNL
jgi:hypothetical protein